MAKGLSNIIKGMKLEKVVDVSVSYPYIAIGNEGKNYGTIENVLIYNENGKEEKIDLSDMKIDPFHLSIYDKYLGLLSSDKLLVYDRETKKEVFSMGVGVNHGARLVLGSVNNSLWVALVRENRVTIYEKGNQLIRKDINNVESRYIDAKFVKDSFYLLRISHSVSLERIQIPSFKISIEKETSLSVSNSFAISFAILNDELFVADYFKVYKVKDKELQEIRSIDGIIKNLYPLKDSLIVFYESTKGYRLKKV